MQEIEQPTAVAVVNEQPHAVAATAAKGSTPADMIMYVMQNGGSVAELREFYQLKREWEADEARKAYVEDMTRFKLNPPTIIKDKHVSFKTEKGRTEYDHATIGNVTNKIISALSAHGFSHSWSTRQEGSQVVVTCTITHRLGHSESFTLQASPDASGGKNAIQAIISAQTYLQRHTLLAATGLATHDQDDDDGAAAGVRPELDVTQADGWIAAVRGCKTEAEVDKLWAEGSKALLKKPAAYDEFKDAVAVQLGKLGVK